MPTETTDAEHWSSAISGEGGMCLTALEYIAPSTTVVNSVPR